MTLTLATDNETYDNTASIVDSPAVRITAAHATLINRGSLAGSGGSAAIVLSGFGSLIDNRVGAVIGAPGAGPAIKGSAGADQVLNAGSIIGLVDLGAGDDEFVQRFGPPSSLASVSALSGGEGTDRLTLIGGFDSGFPATISGFEVLSIVNIGQSGNFNLAGLGGFSRIEVTGNSSLNLIDSANPRADLIIGTGSTGIAGATSVGTVYGDDLRQSFTIFGGLNGIATVSGGVDLAGGDDTLFLHLDFFAPATVPLPSTIQFGSGYDRLVLIDRFHARDLDLSAFQGLEEIADFGNISSFAVTLRNGGAGLRAVNLADRPLTLIGFAAPDAVIATYGDTLTIAAGSVIGRVVPFFGNTDAMTGAFPFQRGIETTIVNAGNIRGDVLFGYSSDVFDGRAGTVGGTVFGLAGDDRLTGGAGNDKLDGGIGGDVLEGLGGDDLLIGGRDIDLAVFAGRRADAVVSADPALGTVTVFTPGEGTATLRGVEQVRFADGLFSFTFADPGAVLIANFAVGAGGWASQDRYPRHLADINGDGLADVVGFGQAGVLASYGRAAGGFDAPKLVSDNFGQTTGWTSDARFHRELADVNGDGRADVIGFGIAGTFVSLASLVGTFAAPTLAHRDFGSDQGWRGEAAFARTTGDVNGDGRADLIGFGIAGTLVSLGRGDGTFSPLIRGIDNFGANQGWTADPGLRRVVADVDGDGRDDIIAFGNAGTYVALSNGDGTFGRPALVLRDFGTAQGWIDEDRFVRLVGDVNGDRRADIVGFGAAGALVAFGRADGFFSEISPDTSAFTAAKGWSSDALTHRELADVDHDGLADLVGFAPAGVIAGLNLGDLVI